MNERPKANDPELVVLCRRHKVRRLDLFGSAATGTFDPARSDFDFLVEFGEALKSGGYFDAYFRLREELITLYGPRGRSGDRALAEESLLPQAGHG